MALLWIVIFLPVGIGFGAKGSVGLQLGIGVLRQVSHHGQLVHIGVDHLLGFDQLVIDQRIRMRLVIIFFFLNDWWINHYLWDSQPVISQRHGFSGILEGILWIPIVPVGTQTLTTKHLNYMKTLNNQWLCLMTRQITRSDSINQSADSATIVPVGSEIGDG